jgi:parvulin-like peptidyl-prolyl isomerase
VKSKLRLATRKIETVIALGVATVTVLSGCDRQNEAPLARVGDRIVSEEAFRHRYTLLLRKTSIRDNMLARQQVLQNLVTEEVLLAGATEFGIPQDPSFQEEVEAIEQQVLLDQYRKLEVFSTVEVSEEELRQAYLRLNTRVTARHLFAKTEEEAQRLRSLLENGVPFDELAATTFHDPELAASGGLVGTFTFGDMDPAFEDVAFTLPVGSVSEPVKTRYGYSIIKVEDRVRQPVISEWQFQRRKRKIAAYVRWVKSIEEAERFTREVAERLGIRFNEAVLAFMAERIAATTDSLSTDQGYEAPALDYAAMLNEIAEESLVTFHGGVWSVAEFLEKARWTSTRQQERVKSLDDLREFIRGLVVRDYLLRQARQRGIHRRADTRDLIARQVRNLTLRRMREALAGTAVVPDSVLRAEYDAHPERYVEPEQVNVREILVESEEKARELLDQIRNGADFSELARQHSLRGWAAERGGELGFAPRGRYGMLADKVFAAKVGDVIGPLKVGEYTSIMQIIGRRPARQKSFEEARRQIEQERLWEWERRAVQDYVESKKQELGVTIDTEKLAQLSVSGSS